MEKIKKFEDFVVESVNLTKKHFEILAKILKEHKAEDTLIEAIAAWLASENPNFNMDLFVKKCK